MWREFNPNPTGARVGDCVVRALAKATDASWEETYIGLCAQGLKMADMPSANHVWGAYLKDNGFARHVLPNTCPDCYTVRDFCEDHPDGTYILALNGHVICTRGGDWRAQGSYGRGMSYNRGGSYGNGGSYARGSSYAKRDSRGRYSRADESMRDKMMAMMQEGDFTSAQRQTLQRMIDEM